MDSSHWQFAAVGENFTKTHQVPLEQALEQYKAMGVIAKMSIPPLSVIRMSRIQFVVEEYENIDEEKSQLYFLQITTPQQEIYRINILDISFCHNLNFLVHWSNNLEQEPFDIKEQIHTTLTANCFDYRPSDDERRERAKCVVNYNLPQLHEIDPTQRSRFFPPQPKPKIPKSKLRSTSQESMLPDLHSIPLDQSIQGLKKVARLTNEWDDPDEEKEKSEESILENMGQDDQLDTIPRKADQFIQYYEFTETTKENIKMLLINWLKQKDNHFKQKPQIEEFLISNQIRLIPRQFKQLLNDTFDEVRYAKQKGYILKHQYMRQNQIEEVKVWLKNFEESLQMKNRGKKTGKY